MRNSQKIATSIGSVALILAGAAAAQLAVPSLGINFGTITNKAGDCSATGYTCKSLADDPNKFVQQQIDGKNGETYIRTWISDPSTTQGTFQSEDFVRINFGTQTNQATQGLASKSSIDDKTKTGFYTDAIIRSGWGIQGNTVATKSQAVINFDLTAVGTTAGQQFNTKFMVDTSYDSAVAGATNKLNGLLISQEVGLGAAADKQKFFTELHAAKAGGTFDGTKLGAAGSGTMTYVTNDFLQVVWIGQSVTNVGAFGTESIKNYTNAAGGIASITSLTAPGPFNWTALPEGPWNGGTAPTF